ncbi:MULTISPECIES: SHOCT domain-containing protein [Mycolicibacterium]|jgi:putative membrane protein|uniref:SHOCT domain-containing protein n=1 Tax=Mycolicibacterium TaxID=1866885 RepID=UPI00056A6523|nr:MULTISPECIES: SHOCT domain-containing protein [Mycolicibacterium]QZY46091.1 SHOCT domain-containing protein [Mycolicibacterium austroafricanum]UJL30206.1 SHOCT domain-containing protein [Mycolicibacterium vanbaalenii]WND56710.1 SHOCT domain-containing protein [Mycolicibacterium vanbaalenii]
MMVWYGGHMGWWGYAAMGIGMVVFWALIIGGIVVLVRLSIGGTTAPAQPPATAEQILAARFARGEIDEAEYRDRLAALRG